MGKFFYTHFGDDVPRHIEDEYNKLRRKEMWIEEKEADFRAYSVDYDELVTVIADPSTLPINEIAAEKKHYFSLGLTSCLLQWKCSEQSFRRVMH